jgi:RES domain-containing protein
LLGIQTTYAKTELVLPQNQVSFSIEKNESFQSLKKEVPPNIGFLKEKTKFEVYEGVSAQNQHDFSEYFVGNLAKGVVRSVDDYKLFWNTLSDIPKTPQKQYNLWRRVDKSWEPAVTHPMQSTNTVNRYSKGREAVYFGRSREVSNAEWLAHNSTTGLRGPNGSKLYRFTVNESDLLDLTNPNILSKLDINPDFLTKIDDKAIPQALGDWAFDNGYKGIIFPSARMNNEANVVIFKYFQGNTPPSISVTDLIETID